MGINEIIKIGDQIKKYRKNLHLTQEQMAEKLLIPRSTYANYEKNTREPSAETLNSIAEALGVTINDLIADGVNLTDMDNNTLDFLYGNSDLILLKDIFKNCNYELSEDSSSNVIIKKEDKILAIVPEKDFIDSGKNIISHIQEFSEFELSKLIGDYHFLY